MGVTTNLFEGIDFILKVGVYAIIYGLTTGLGTLITLVVALFIGAGWYIVPAIGFSIGIGVLLDRLLLHR